MTREYTCPPGDHIPCPKCGACGGPAGAIRVRGMMTEQQYNDRRCNSCGHLWTIGGTLDLPLEVPGKPIEQAKGESGIKVPPSPEAAPGPSDYDFGDGWEPDPGSTVPF